MFEDEKRMIAIARSMGKDHFWATVQAYIKITWSRARWWMKRKRL